MSSCARCGRGIFRYVQILMVCVGNVCRSPVAERLLVGGLEGVVPDGSVTVASAGVHAVVGAGVDPDAATQLELLGGDAQGFEARQLNEAMVGAADLVLTATKEVRRELLRLVPAALHRSFTLKEMAAVLEHADVDALPTAAGMRAVARELSRGRATVSRGSLDIEDPVGATPEVHARVAAEILSCLERLAPLVETIATSPPAPAAPDATPAPPTPPAAGS